MTKLNGSPAPARIVGKTTKKKNLPPAPLQVSIGELLKARGRR